MRKQNTVHREVGLQANLKMVLSLIRTKFSGKEAVDQAIKVINRVAGESQKIGFLSHITGTGTVLGNVMILDLNIPLMAGYPRNESDETVFNITLARALVKEFGHLNVGYVSPEPSRTRTVTLRVETEQTTEQLLNALAYVTETAEVV